MLKERIKCIIFYSFSKYLLTIGFPPLSPKPACACAEEASASRGEIDTVSVNLNIFLQLSLLKHKQWEASAGSHREGWNRCRGGVLIVELGNVCVVELQTFHVFSLLQVFFPVLRKVGCVSCLSDDSPQCGKAAKDISLSKSIFQLKGCQDENCFTAKESCKGEV